MIKSWLFHLMLSVSGQLFHLMLQRAETLLLTGPDWNVH